MTDNYLIKSRHEHHLMLVEAAYKGLVRPVLEYGRSVWDLHTHGFHQELAKVQNRAARFVIGIVFLKL